jgi:hypothetical protein
VALHESTEYPCGGAVKETVSHAKAQRKSLETRQRFAPLRLCVRNLVPAGTFRAKPL